MKTLLFLPRVFSGTHLLYFDHNATSPLAPEAGEALAAASREVYGNASSMHRQGQLARRHFEASRATVAHALGASPSELVFTSGGTESNNLAIFGLLRSLPAGTKHVVTTAIEHPSVLELFRQLEREGVDVTYARAGSSGIVDIEELRRSLGENTVLVSAMHANNETGAIQPIAQIAELLRPRGIYFHCDGVQAFGKIPVHVHDLGIDLYSASAHKLYGPKGAGALFVRKGVPFGGIQRGGRQERERRAGTENVPAAMGFARAVELCATDGRGVRSMRDRFEDEVFSALEGVEVNGSSTNRLPNTSNLLFHGISAEALVIALDMKGMAVSTGSACSSGSIEPSHVLLAMGRTREQAKSSVRFSFGRYNTMADVEALAAATVACTRQLRRTESRELRLA